MKHESYTLSKPYPPFMIRIDGPALVISIGKFYHRFTLVKSHA